LEKEMTQEERNEKIAETLAANQSKSGLVEKLVFTLLPICVSAIGWLLTQVSTLNNQITVLNNKVAVVVNAENKAIPPQGTTIEMEAIRAAASQARADMRMDIIEKITSIKEGAQLERAEIKQRLAVLEYQASHKK
jgi:hypothetical protein